MLLRIAWRNLWRYRRRTLITASGMALAMGLVMSMACMQDGMFDTKFGHYEWFHRRKEQDKSRHTFHL